MWHTGTKGKKYAIPYTLVAVAILYSGCLNAKPEWESAAAVLSAARAVLPITQEEQFHGTPPSTQGWVKACQNTLSARVTAITRWSATVQISCISKTASEPSWSLYVPFQRSYMQQVILARHFLRAGAVIRRRDVRIKTMPIDAQTGPVCTRLSEVLGHTLTAGTPGGMPLRPNEIVAPLLVRQGERVVLEAHDKNIWVKTMGTALEDGRIGSQLLVRNNMSHKDLMGVVEANGSVLLSTGVVP